MSDALERYVEEVAPGIVGKALQRQPFGFQLVAEGERGDLDFRLLADKLLGDGVEKAFPFRLE